MQTCIGKVKNQTPSLLPANTKKKTLDRIFKVKNPNLYYENLHMKCYYFCQQYENYFKTANIKCHKRVFFAILFL